MEEIKSISALPPDKRAAAFAEALAFEGRTFRAILQAVRFVTCKPATRSAFAAVIVAQAGTASSAAAAAGILVMYMPWVALYPPALVTAVVGLITVMGVEGFCAWSGPYLAKFSKTQDTTATVGDHG